MADPADSSRDPSRTRTSCMFCKADGTGRNLILSFDGTSNQYGVKNTNVIELHARIIKDENQLRYYNSGIGTYARPSWRSYNYWKQVINNKIDLAIAWNFEKGVFAGYRWLSNHYQPGDKIFLFGFSRGAYQVRTIAGMIDRVGLLLPGNEEQIPFAFELYADLKGKSDDETVRFFKDTFSQDNVKVHFLGAWDTVSSVGLVRGRNLPRTDEFNPSICYFRHALALDERRVKYLPEYVCGGMSYDPSSMTEQPEHSNAAQSDDGSLVPRVKEVWFAGCHSDIGGGNKSNRKLDNAAVPVLWMGNEANLAGLKLGPSKVVWNWEELKQNKPVKSLRSVWRWFELWPFKRLSYNDRSSTTWWPHLKDGRVIKPGQKIHASVAFIEDYKPKANFAEGMTEKTWDDILGMGKQDEFSWTKEIREILEMDLFDHSNVKTIIDELELNMQNSHLISRLEFMASTREGAQAITSANPKFTLFCMMLGASDGTKLACMSIMEKVFVHATLSSENMQEDVIFNLTEMLRSDDTEILTNGKTLLLILASTYEGAKAISIADPNLTSFHNVPHTEGSPTLFHSAIQEAIRVSLSYHHVQISLDDTHTVLTPGFCQFELTVIGTTGLRKTPMWSQSQGGYVTVAVGGREIHKTPVVDTRGDPQWKDTFQFVAKRDDELTISIYATKDSSSNTLLGKVKESLEEADHTGEEMSRKVSATQCGTPFDLKFRFKPRSRLFGLIIGIDEYESDEIRNLQGCKADAQSMVDLLSRKFHIRSSHFLCLANKRATRSAIIDGFQHHLIENSNIERGDAILIFYAGHGSRAAAPKGWVADGSEVETICPCDERTLDCYGKEIFGIPDRTIGGLLRKLCSFKGDNITVVFDSCHSGGNTGMLEVTRQTDNPSPLPEELDRNIWTWGLPPKAESNVPIGFLDMTVSSHVLLAACGPNEVALEKLSTENVARGAFTRCLVDVLDQQKDLTRITYSALIGQLPPLYNQHPQCIGKNSGRALFGAVPDHPTLLKLSIAGGKYRINVGEIYGVVPGTPFTIYAHNGFTLTSSEIGVLEADHVSPHSCTLRWRGGKKFDIPSGARVLMLNWRPYADVLKVSIEPSQDDVKSIEGIFSLVDYFDRPDLMIHCTPGGTRGFERLDPIISKYARLLDNIPPEPSLSDVLKGVSHFNFHLSRGNTEQPLKKQIEVVLHRLKRSNPDEESEEAIYMPDGDTGMLLVVDGENVAFAARDVFYGLSVTNHSRRHLFPYLVYFDPSDYSIQSWYHPPVKTMAAPLPALHKDKGPSELKVGYGEADAKPFQFTLADGIPADVGFLRLFVSTTYVDMSVLEQQSPLLVAHGGATLKQQSPFLVAHTLEQQSPFLVARGGLRAKSPVMDIWDAWTYVLKTVRR